jgi:uncharacterized protein
MKSYTHDEDGRPYLTRTIFIRIKKLLRDFLAGQKEIRIAAIPGLRGVGKTTVLAQLFMELYKERPDRILYISADQIVNTLGSDLHSALEAFQKLQGASFESLESPLFLFIDEVHFDPKWPSVLKNIYDRSKQVFVLCTGSSALSLPSSTDLARRAIFEKLYPMNFTEYILLKSKHLATQNSQHPLKFPEKGLKSALKNTLFFSQNAQDCFKQLQCLQRTVDQYWYGIDSLEIDRFMRFGTMPFALTIKNQERVHVLIHELIDKVVEKDLFEIEKFDASTIERAKAILLLVAASSEVSVNKIAATIKGIAINTLSDVLHAMERAEILIRIYPYGSAYKQVRKPSKYHFMSPSIRHVLLTLVEGQRAFEMRKGYYLEDLVALTLHREFGQKLLSPVMYDSAQGGADFIVNLQNKNIVLEIGYGEKGIRQAETTFNKINGNYGLVISDSDLSLHDNVVKVPIGNFLLI